MLLIADLDLSAGHSAASMFLTEDEVARQRTAGRYLSAVLAPGYVLVSTAPDFNEVASFMKQAAATLQGPYSVSCLAEPEAQAAFEAVSLSMAASVMPEGGRA